MLALIDISERDGMIDVDARFACGLIAWNVESVYIMIPGECEARLRLLLPMRRVELTPRWRESNKQVVQMCKGHQHDQG
jgi:hypothetical protein